MATRWTQKALALNPRDKNARDALSFARSELSTQKLKKPAVGSFQEARAQDLERSLAGASLPPRPSGQAAKADAKDADPVPRVLAGLLLLRIAPPFLEGLIEGITVTAWQPVAALQGLGLGLLTKSSLNSNTFRFL